MLGAVTTILHHPLACLAFALWSFVRPFGEGGDSMIHSMLGKIGYEDLNFEEVWKAHTKHPVQKHSVLSAVDSFATPAWALDTAKPEPSDKTTTDAPVATTTKAQCMDDPKFHDEAGYRCSDWAGYKCERSGLSKKGQKELVEKCPKTCDSCPDSDPDADDRMCGGDLEHLGKWRIGSAYLQLHYVCELHAKNTNHTACPDGWNSFQKSCYFVELQQTAPAFAATDACSDKGGHLVILETKAENQFVQELVGRESVWIGLDKINGNWSWANDQAMNYTNWDANQPKYNFPAQAVFMNFWKEVCMPPPWFNGNDGSKAFMAMMVMGVVFAGIILIVSMIAPCIFACLYKKHVTNNRQTIPDFRGYATQQIPQAQNFRFKLCGCLEDMSICTHAFCCGAVRSGDTHNAAGTEKFWTVIMLWVLSYVIGAVLGGSSGMDRTIAGVVMAAIMTGKRQALKARLGIERGSSCEDFMLWWCCSPCVVAQEAREVDAAAGVSVGCCFSLKQRTPPASQIVGPAISADPFNAVPLQVMNVAPPAAAAAAPQPQPPLPVTAQVVRITPPQGTQVHPM